jgi:hypothetical protein
MVLLTMLHLCNGAANIKNKGNKILVPSDCFLLPNGGNLLVPQIIRQKDIDHHVPKHIQIICHLPDPPKFSLVPIFKEHLFLVKLSAIPFLASCQYRRNQFIFLFKLPLCYTSGLLILSYYHLSVLRIRDVYPGSQIRIFSIPDPGSRIRIKEFKYF